MSWLSAYPEDHPLIDRGVSMDEACATLRGRLVAVSVDWPGDSARQRGEQARAAECICTVFAAAGITAVAPGAFLHRLAEPALHMAVSLGGPHTQAGALWSSPILRVCAALYVPKLPGWDAPDGRVAEDARYMLGRNNLVLTEAFP